MGSFIYYKFKDGEFTIDMNAFPTESTWSRKTPTTRKENWFTLPS